LTGGGILHTGTRRFFILDLTTYLLGIDSYQISCSIKNSGEVFVRPTAFWHTRQHPHHAADLNKEEIPMSKETKLTTNAGAPVVDNQNVMTAGPRGPQLLQDV